MGHFFKKKHQILCEQLCSLIYKKSLTVKRNKQLEFGEENGNRFPTESYCQIKTTQGAGEMNLNNR
jgi:hypothetical protein